MPEIEVVRVMFAMFPLAVVVPSCGKRLSPLTRMARPLLRGWSALGGRESWRAERGGRSEQAQQINQKQIRFKAHHVINLVLSLRYNGVRVVSSRKGLDFRKMTA